MFTFNGIAEFPIFCDSKIGMDSALNGGTELSNTRFAK